MPPKTRSSPKQKAEETSFEDSKENLKDKSEETNEQENFASQIDCPNGKEAKKIGLKRKRQPSENQDTNVEVPEEQPKTKKEPPKTRLPSKQKAVKKGSKRKGKSSGNEDTSFEDSKENLKVKSEETNERENFATQKDCPNGKEATKIGSKRKRQPSKNQDTNVEVPEDQPESKKKGANKRENLANGKEATKKGSKRKEQTSEIKDKDSQSDNIGNITTENEYGKYQKYNKDKLWKLKKIPHHILPSFNISKNTDIKNVRDFPLIQISLPHSVYVNPKFSEDIDFCHRRTIALNSYMTRLKAVKTGYFSAKKKSKSLRKNENKGIYCKQLIDFAERREFHPDKYFMQDYDFYYTGGNLCINNQTNQIAHVAGTKMNTLVLSVFNVQHNIPKVHRLTTVEFKNSGDDECEIFEVQTSSSKEEFFFLRQKHCVSIQEFSSGKMNVVQNFKTKDVPFISFTQDLVNTHHLAISDLVHKVRVCDLEKGVPIQTLRLMPREQIKSANNWNMIKSMDSFVYIYSASKKVSIIDTRLPESEWKSNYSGISEENSCNNFCSLARSKFENLFYVGSSHKAYCVDRRYMGKDVDSRNAVVACWTHQMSTFPLIMATTCINDSEYIALQSPVSSDLRICENMQFMDETESNTVTEYSYNSPSLPYMPPSIESVFQEARVQGKCAKPSTGMCDRVKACITGLCFTDDRPSSYLLTATSNGDIFARHIHNPELDVKPDTATAFQVMSEFEDNICRSVRKIPLAITEVCNLAGISKVFRCPHLSGLQKEEDFDFSSKRKYMGRWQKSIETLSKYKDALATDLISIWDFDIEEGRDLNITSLNKTEVSDSKVSGWLENIPEIENTTIFNMTSIPMDVLNASNLNDTIADTSFNENDQTNNKSNIDLDKSVRTVKPKTAKKKSRYIKGF